VTAVLLDTHALLWFVFDDPRLSSIAEATIADPRVTKLLSVTSLWEIVIKSQLGKLRLGMKLEDFLDVHVTGSEIELVALELGHLLGYHSLPLAHRDPFDRMLVAQAGALGVPVLTADPAFALFDVKVIW
jgi:PIN domain nuclease of toxin-antitoxin system